MHTLTHQSQPTTKTMLKHILAPILHGLDTQPFFPASKATIMHQASPALGIVTVRNKAKSCSCVAVHVRLNYV